MAPTRRTTALVLVASVLIVGGVIAASLVWTDTVLLGDDDSDRHVKEIMFAAALGTTMGVAVVLLICACACAYDIPDP